MYEIHPNDHPSTITRLVESWSSLDSSALFPVPVIALHSARLFVAPMIGDSAMVARSDGIIVGGPGHLARQLLERLPLRLGDEQRGEDTAQHEEREDLHDVVQPGRVGRAGWRTLLTERAEDTLGHDGADLAAGGRETVGCGSITGWEAFTGDDEGGCVGS